MANDRIKWQLTEQGGLNVSQGNEMFNTYDLTTIYPDFNEFTEVQRMVVVYGVKQNLSDKIANMKDYTIDEKMVVMNKRFQSLVDGIWKSPTKEKTSIKKKVAAIVAEGTLTDIEKALLTKLGLA